MIHRDNIMTGLNRDTIIAIILLIVCGVFFYNTFGIRAFPEQMSPALWPRIILFVLTFLCLIYLFQSIMASNPEKVSRGGFKGWLQYYQNPIYCFICFFVFLLIMPYLGMLISGILFVFTVMTVLGGRSSRDLSVNLFCAVLTVGGMWLIFTQLLGVILPTSMFTYAF